MNAVVAEQTKDQLPTPAGAQAANLQQLQPVSAAEAHYQLQRRKAVDYSKSTLVPDAYRGNPPNVMIAMEIAQRIGASDLMVMQNLYIVHGRPSWSSQFLIASVNASKRFTPIRFEVVGEDPFNKAYKVRAVATDVKTGDECKGAWITWKMIDGEGWEKKTGSKWKTMPEQMFQYRAATFWARVYAPEVSMGILTKEEINDVIDLPDSAVQRTDLRTLESKLLGKETTSDADMEPLPAADKDGVEITAESVKAKLEAAANQDELDDAYDTVRLIESVEDRRVLHDLYEERCKAFE